MIRSIHWENNSVTFLDQTALPLRESYLQTADISVLAEAIKTLKIRGAPLLGIAAAYGVLLGLLPVRNGTRAQFVKQFDDSVRIIGATRPTATNLFWALERLKSVVRLNDRDQPPELFEKLRSEAVLIHEEDRRMCEAIGRFGAELIPDHTVVLTHCNTGALATGGIGTAFGVLWTAFRSGKKISVIAGETRPLLQGARLTMWELQKAGIPATLIADNAAAWAIRTHKVGLIITGADRIAANGDTANKIGTYGLAVLAKEHGIPMYIAAPTSTIDRTLPDGGGIPIEVRHPEEVSNGFGLRTAPEGSAVFAPAFDVTPNGLITAIITEHGVLRPPFTTSIAAVTR